MRPINQALLAAACLGWAGCDRTPPAAEQALAPLCEEALATLEPPPVETLRWKRAPQLTRDLAQALSMDRASLCFELGNIPCAELYRVALGGSDPFGSGVLVPPREPQLTTPMTTERFVLGACRARVDADREGEAEVFTRLDLDAEAVTADQDGLREDTAELFRRLLLRDATDDELATVTALADGAVGARDYAIAACFTVGTTTEFLLY